MATINLVFDSDTAAAPAGFDNAIQAAANLLDAAITSPVNITIEIGYNETGGQAITAGAAASANFYGDELPYAEVYNALVQHAASDEQKSILANIPSTPPTPAFDSIRVSQAQEQALGLPVGTGGQSPSGGPAGVDGIAGFGSGGGVFTWYTGTDFNLANATTLNAIDLETAAEHELSHALGRIVGPNPGAPITIENLTDYSARGVLASDATSTGNYFSIDGGQTEIEQYDAYNVAQNSGDPADGRRGLVALLISSLPMRRSNRRIWIS